MATLLVSILGLKGSAAKELTAALATVVGVIPYGVSKLVDWKRHRDKLEAERIDLLERGVVAVERLVDAGLPGNTADQISAMFSSEEELEEEDPEDP